ncbi:hypothetical protein GCM10010428_08880 [Actinosynnema pretiosum subsp. pretiosum]
MIRLERRKRRRASRFVVGRARPGGGARPFACPGGAAYDRVALHERWVTHRVGGRWDGDAASGGEIGTRRQASGAPGRLMAMATATGAATATEHNETPPPD